MQRIHWLLLGLLAGLWACAAPAQPESQIMPIVQQPPVVEIELKQQAESLTWLDPGLVVSFFLDPVEQPRMMELRWLAPDNPAGTPLPIPMTTAYEQILVISPKHLPDGRLQSIRHEFTPATRGLPDHHYTLEAFDPQTEAVTTLIEGERLGAVISNRLKMAWAPDMQRALLSTDAVLHSDMYWWTPAGGLEPFDSQVENCSAIAWSPDGTQIVYEGQPKIPGVTGTSPNNPANLYLMNADGSNQRVLVPDLMYVQGLDWSPDGEWLVYTADYGPWNQVWVVRVATGERYRLTDGPGNYWSTVWSPDGTQIAAMWEEMGVERARQFVHIIDLPSELRQ